MALGFTCGDREIHFLGIYRPAATYCSLVWSNYLLYDRSFNPITQGWKRVSTSAGFDPGMEAFSTHEKLTIPTVNITEPGYIYVFVSNESENTEVWFDDLKIAHERSKVVAGADYYPFGLVMENREITREHYRYGYQGQFSEEDNATGYNEFDLRMYDPKIGRWLSSDPYGQYYSPYLAMNNTPHMSADADGGWSWITAGIGFAVGATAGYIASDGDWRWALAGGVAGGALGGAMFDQTSSLYDVGTVESSRRLQITWRNSAFKWANSFGSAFNELYRIPLKKLLKEEGKNFDSPNDVLNHLDDSHPDLENDRKERLVAVNAFVSQEGPYTRQPGYGRRWKDTDFSIPMYTNPGTIKKSNYRYVYGPQKIYRGRTLRINNKQGVFYIQIHFKKP
jgi:RHS repeat-associated protein